MTTTTDNFPFEKISNETPPSVNRAYQPLHVNSFIGSGGTGEYCIIGTAPAHLPIEEALAVLAHSYKAKLEELGLKDTTRQFVRFMISDAANEKQQLLSSDLYSMVKKSACSLIEQPPIDGGYIAFMAYHLTSPENGFYPENGSTADTPNVCMRGANYSLFWSPGLCSTNAAGSEQQTTEILSALADSLAQHSMSMARNTVRTWIYVRDIDNNYAGMVKSRREYFESIGLTDATRYIASTGIEGKGPVTSALVSLDALSISPLREEQIIRMEAPHNMSSTITYGVTFERGTRIRFGDRSHLYISGTASIDTTGAVLHLSDVKKQVERTFDNVEALLEPQNATLNDLLYLTIYLRNPKHYPLIKDILARRIPEKVPYITVHAPVCRPEWLFEVDGLAIIPDTTEFPPLG